MINNKKSEWIYTVCLLLVAITLPTKWKQLNSICVLVLCGVWLVDVLASRRLNRVVKNRLFLVSGALYVLYAASLFYSLNVSQGLKGLESRFTLFALPLIILSIQHFSYRMLHVALAGFVAVCITVSLVCIVGTFYVNHLQGISYSEATSWQYSADNLVSRFGFHPSYFAIYAATAIFITVYFYQQKLVRIIPCILVALYFFGFILLLASRVGILAVVAVAALTILYEAYRRKALWVGLGLTVALLLVVSLGIYQSDIAREKFYAAIGYKVHQYNEPFSMSIRYSEWASALQIIKTSPVIGVGVGDVQDELQKVYLARGFKEGYEQRYGTHSLFLDTAIGTGLIGVVALLFIFYVSFKNAIDNRNLLYLQFLLLFFLISVVESTFSVQKGIVFFSFMNALFAAMSALPSRTASTTPNVPTP